MTKSMRKYAGAMAVVLGLGATPAFAAEQSMAGGPAKMTDAQLDEVVAGDPLLFVNVAAPISVHLEPISVSVNIPVNVAAIVQANVLGNATFDALAVGTQNVFQAAAGLSATH